MRRRRERRRQHVKNVELSTISNTSLSRANAFFQAFLREYRPFRNSNSCLKRNFFESEIVKLIIDAVFDKWVWRLGVVLCIVMQIRSICSTLAEAYVDVHRSSIVNAAFGMMGLSSGESSLLGKVLWHIFQSVNSAVRAQLGTSVGNIVNSAVQMAIGQFRSVFV